MTSSIADLISALPEGDGWGPAVTTETTLDGVPYAPFSKGDKLGRMADWTTDGKDGRDGRGGRAQYNRNYRGACVREQQLSGYLAVVSVSIPISILQGTQEADLTCFFYLVHRSADIRRNQCLPLHRPHSRARRSLFLRRLQCPRLRQVPFRPWRRLHPRPWPARWCPRRLSWWPSTVHPHSRPRWCRWLRQCTRRTQPAGRRCRSWKTLRLEGLRQAAAQPRC